jgi:hypothetical protein
MNEQQLVKSLSRRGFMSTAGSAMLAALAASNPRQLWAAQKKPQAKADTLILLWMAGGMAQT